MFLTFFALEPGLWKVIDIGLAAVFVTIVIGVLLAVGWHFEEAIRR